jgi:capsid protein
MKFTDVRDNILGISDLKKNSAEISKVNETLTNKITQLNSDNQKMNSIMTTMGYGYEFITGESNAGDLPEVKEILIIYNDLRLRSWQFIFNNHIANLIVTKRINWQIGSGLLFNSKPSEKPFIAFYGDKKGKEKHKEFVTNIEYQYRNIIKSKDVDNAKESNLHEMARIIDFNAAGDGDVLLLMRIENGLPNIQVISGQAVCDPWDLTTGLTSGHSVNEGVEKNAKNQIVAYHVLKDTNMSNTEHKPAGEVPEWGTRRIPVYFKNSKFKKAWLYRASDLRKLGETRSMPLLSNIFESLQHINDYIIANTKNAQLKAQLVVSFDKDANSDGSKVFNQGANIAGLTTTTTPNDTVSDDLQTHNSAVKFERDMKGNGIVIDPGKGVKTNMVNDTAQSDQKEFLKSTFETLFANAGYPIEFMLSSYNSNYTASMGARSDTQHSLDVTNEIIPSAQLYKMHYNMTLYLMVLSGKIECEPLKKAYLENDIVTIQAISNSTFEGTKLKPIDPVKFIKALRAQLPKYT